MKLVRMSLPLSLPAISSFAQDRPGDFNRTGQLMGGRLQVESEVGKGSKFWFELRFLSPAQFGILHATSGQVFHKIKIVG